MTNYTVDTLEKETDIGEFTALCLDTEKCRFACAECPAYGSNYSCPPFSFKTEDYLRPFGRVKLIMRVFQFSDIKKEKAFKILEEERKIFFASLSEREKQGITAADAGPCNLCPRCAREKGEECRAPGKTRYSLEALGFDLEKAAEIYFGIPLKWAKDRLPDYMVQIFALFIPR